MITDLLFYEQSGGVGEFYTTFRGSINLLLPFPNANHDWRTSWTQIIPGKFGGQGFTDLLFYQASTGTGESYSTDGLGGILLLEQHSDWRTSWTQIIPGNFGGDGLTDLLFYDAGAGVGEFYTVFGAGKIKLLRQHTGWRTSWTQIIPGNFGGSGSTDLLFYEAATGTGEFYTSNGSGGISLLHQHTNWRSSWTHIVPGNFGGNAFTDLLFYEALTGTGEFYKVDQGKITLLREHTGWRTSWTQIIPGNFGGDGATDLLFYEASTGKGEFYTTNNGNITLLNEHTNWRSSWTNIVPGLYAPSKGLRLHLKLLLQPGDPIENQLAQMREVYLTAGIRVIVRSTEILNLPDLLDVNVGECKSGFGDNITGDVAELYSHRRNVGDNEMVIYFVEATIRPAGGCAHHPPGKPGAIVTESHFPYALPHEVGHVYGFSHTSNKDLLMTPGPRSHLPPDLTVLQKQHINSVSNFTITL